MVEIVGNLSNKDINDIIILQWQTVLQRLGFASKDNVLMKSISSGKGETDVQMEGKSSASLGSGSIIKLCSNTCKVALVYRPIGGCP